MNIFKKIISLFRKKRVIIPLSAVEYDKLVDSKLEKIRTYIRSYISDVRDNDILYETRFEDAFKSYENSIKKEINKSDSNNRIIYSPINALTEYYKLSQGQKKNNCVVRLYKTIKFKIGLYYQHILFMREIRKIKKLFPDMKISNQRAINLINSAKINEKCNKLYPQKK